jgi:hypothetical protein
MKNHLRLSLWSACLALSPAQIAWANAPANRYTISAGNVRDNKTGLTWQQQFKTGVTPIEARDYCKSLGGTWRLPTIKELVTIYDFSYPGGGAPGNIFLDPAFGSVTSGNATFWSSTPKAGDPNSSWGVLFEVWITNVMTGDSTEVANARCVR